MGFKNKRSWRGPYRSLLSKPKLSLASHNHLHNALGANNLFWQNNSSESQVGIILLSIYMSGDLHIYMNNYKVSFNFNFMSHIYVPI